MRRDQCAIKRRRKIYRRVDVSSRDAAADPGTHRNTCQKKIRGTYQMSERMEIRRGFDIPMAHPKFMERNDCKTFVNQDLNKLNGILTPRADDATFGFVESTTWQADPAPKMTKSATPKNSAMGLRIACLGRAKVKMTGKNIEKNKTARLIFCSWLRKEDCRGASKCF